MEVTSLQTSLEDLEDVLMIDLSFTIYSLISAGYSHPNINTKHIIT